MKAEMHMHLALTTEEVVARLHGDWDGRRRRLRPDPPSHPPHVGSARPAASSSSSRSGSASRAMRTELRQAREHGRVRLMAAGTAGGDGFLVAAGRARRPRPPVRPARADRARGGGLPSGARRPHPGSTRRGSVVTASRVATVGVVESAAPLTAPPTAGPHLDAVSQEWLRCLRADGTTETTRLPGSMRCCCGRPASKSRDDDRAFPICGATSSTTSPPRQQTMRS